MEEEKDSNTKNSGSNKNGDKLLADNASEQTNEAILKNDDGSCQKRIKTCLWISSSICRFGTVACWPFVVLGKISPHGWTAIATMLLVLVTIFLAWIANSQLQDGRIENRPWISFANDAVINSRDFYGQWDVSLNFTNVGKTAAFLKNYSVYAAVLKASPAENVYYGMCDYKSSRVLGPGIPAINACRFPDPTTNGGAGYIYVFAKVVYEDSSGHEHFAHFCKYIVHHEMEGELTSFCPTYNDVDKN